MANRQVPDLDHHLVNITVFKITHEFEFEGAVYSGLTMVDCVYAHKPRPLNAVGKHSPFEAHL